jgi:hypothetical protein
MAAAVAWLLLELRNGRAPWLRQLDRELREWLPVFSAETIRGREAEFIRDRLPKQAPTAIVVLSALLVMAAVVWWWLA